MNLPDLFRDARGENERRKSKSSYLAGMMGIEAIDEE